MSLPWFKGRTAPTVAGMMRHRWTKEHPCPKYVAELELQAITANEQRADWSVRDLACRWGWARSSTDRWLRKTEQLLVKCWDNTKLESHELTDEAGTDVGRMWDSSRTRAPSGEKEKEREKTPSSGKPDPVVPSKAQEVYDHWRTYHTRAAKKMTSDRRTMINARLRDSDLESCKLVTRWVHEGPDAAFYRGDNDRGQVYTGIGTLFKATRWGDRVERAQAWEAAGCPDTASPTQTPRDRTKEQEDAGFRLMMAHSGMTIDGNPLGPGDPWYDEHRAHALPPLDSPPERKGHVINLNLGADR